VAKKSIGEANVKLTVEGAEQVASKLKDVKADLESTAVAGETTGRKINGAFNSVGQKIEGATSGIRKLTRSLTAVLGVFSALSLVFGTVFGIFIEKARKSREEAEKLKTDIDNINASVKSLAVSLDKIQPDKVSPDEQIDIEESRALNELFKERQRILDGIKDPAFSTSEGLAQKRNEEQRQRVIQDALVAEQNIRQKAAEARARLEEQRAEDNAENDVRSAEESANKQKQIEESLADQLESIRISSLDGEERVLAEYQRRREDRERAYQEAVEAGRQREADLLDAIDRQDAENTNRAIERIREQERARDEADQNRAQQDQQRQEDQAARELAQALRDAARAVQDSAKIMNDNNRAIERLYQQVVNLVPAVKKTAEESTRRRVM
jgi:hypothetical protein